jgi:hypothetical protein
MDFTSDFSVVWASDCVQNGIGLYPKGSCANEPTLMDTYFDAQNNN